MIVAVPSKGRAGNAKTVTFLGTEAVLFVPTVEVEAYQDCYPANTVVGVPMTIRGITPTRNWILDTVDDPDVVMVDDDVKVQGWVELREENGKHHKLTAANWLAEWARLFEVTRGAGYRIWGVATQSAIRAVHPSRPILWRSYVTASCMGICNESGIRFDVSFPVKEDYEMTLRCIAEDGGLVAARYLYWENEHWDGLGGCGDYRTQEIERAAIRRLTTMYPGMVRQISRGGSDFSIELTL